MDEDTIHRDVYATDQRRTRACDSNRRAAAGGAKADRVEGDRTAVAVRRLGEPTPGHRVRQHPTPLRRRLALAQHRLTRRREAEKGTVGMNQIFFASPRLRVTPCRAANASSRA